MKSKNQKRAWSSAAATKRQSSLSAFVLLIDGKVAGGCVLRASPVPSVVQFVKFFSLCLLSEKERKKTDNPREGWEDGTPPPHRDFKERCVVRYPSVSALPGRSIL